MRSIDWFLLKQLRHKPKVDGLPRQSWLIGSWTNSAGAVLLDVRTEEEWNVSHLPGARRVDPNVSGEKATWLAEETAIVTYCAVLSVGCSMTKLGEAGFTNVRNLEGSIFQWANRPLVRDDKPVTTVHPYSSRGRLLTDDARHHWRNDISRCSTGIPPVGQRRLASAC
jgi:rhodanese-related sulfurtransferase